MPNHFEIKNLLLFSQPNTLFPHTVCIAVLHIKVNVFLKEHSDFNASFTRFLTLFLPDTGTGLNQPIYSNHVTQASRNRAMNEKGTDAFIYLVQNVDLNKNGSNTKMTFEMLQIKHGLAPWGGWDFLAYCYFCVNPENFLFNTPWRSFAYFTHFLFLAAYILGQ